MTGKRTEGPRGKALGTPSQVPAGRDQMRFRLPVASEGWPFIFVSLVFTLAVIILTESIPAAVFFSAVSLFVIAFFRDPEREVPLEASAIVSPADGRVIKVEKVFDRRFLGEEARRISIFMSLFNVHVNRVPFEGRVLRVVYNPGRFFTASLDKASLDNEQNAVVAEGPDGRPFVFNQIAGLVARRIVCYLKEGDCLKKGKRFGLIRFGSRVDLYLPVDCRVVVQKGQTVRAGSDIVGYWR